MLYLALFYFVLLYRALLCPALLSNVLHDLVACFVCVWDLWVRPSGLWECSFTYVFWFVRFMFLLFGAVVCSIGNITRDFPFNWIVFASVSYNLRASHSPIVLKIRTRNFSLAATGIITETRAPLHRQGRNSLPYSLISTVLYLAEDAKQRKTKVSNLREWSLTSLAENRPTIQQQFCLSKGKKLMTKFAIDQNLSQGVDDAKVWSLCVASRSV